MGTEVAPTALVAWGDELALGGVTAAIDPAGATAAVLRVAGELGSRLQRPVRSLHVTETPAGRRWASEVAQHADRELTLVGGEPGTVLPARARLGDDLLVLGLRDLWDDRRGPGHVARATLLAATRPLVLVPAACPPDVGIARIVVALEDAPDDAAALASVTERLVRAGCTVRTVHVVDSAATPACLDHDGRDLEVWRAELAVRHGVAPPLVVRRGDPAGCLLQEADPATTDLVVLVWRGRSDRGHAAVLREVLRRVRVPVMVVPLPGDPSPADRAP